MILAIVDKNINEIVIQLNALAAESHEDSKTKTKSESKSEDSKTKTKSESESEYEYEEEYEEESSYHLDIENSFNITNNDDKETIIYKKSKLIFLVNDESINQFYDNCTDDLELFNSIKNKFDNQIIIEFININDHLTYKSFLDTFNSICLKSKSFRSEIIKNLNCIHYVFNMSSLYISIKESLSSKPQIIDSIIRQRYESLNNNFDLLNEIENYSLEFDIRFKKESCLVVKK